MNNPDLLELYSGSRRLSRTMEKAGYSTFSIDNNFSLEADLCTDILYIDPSKLPSPNIAMWASPPCQAHSQASRPHYWIKEGGDSKPRRSSTFIGIAHLYKTLEIIKELNPPYWFIENPRGKMRILFEDAAKAAGIGNYCRVELTFCQYEKTRDGKKPPQKPTDIFTNHPTWKPRPVCSPGAPCHDPTNGDINGGVQAMKNDYERGKLPLELCTEILELCTNGEPAPRSPLEPAPCIQPDSNPRSRKATVAAMICLDLALKGGMSQYSLKQSGINALAVELGINIDISRTTIFRIIKELEDHKLIQKNSNSNQGDTKTYVRGKALCRILERYRDRHGLSVTSL